MSSIRDEAVGENWCHGLLLYEEIDKSNHVGWGKDIHLRLSVPYLARNHRIEADTIR